MTVPGVGGQPLKYDTKQLLNKWQEYKDYCKDGELLANIAGFCLFADISRETLYNYFRNEKYIDTKNKIERDIEEIAVQQGINAKNPAFLIFYMKNKCGWKDRQELDVNADLDAQINVKFVPSTEDD